MLNQKAYMLEQSNHMHEHNTYMHESKGSIPQQEIYIYIYMHEQKIHMLEQIIVCARI